MVLEGLRGYLQLANGLTDVTRERALVAARSLVAQGEAGVDAVLSPERRSQVSTLTDDLIAISRANRDLLVGLIRAEVDRAVARFGLAMGDELAAARARAQDLDDRVHLLERELRSARSGTSAPAKKTAKKSAAKRSAAKKSAAKKSAAKRSAAKRSAAKRSAAKKSAAKRSAAKKSAAKNSTAKKTAESNSTSPS